MHFKVTALVAAVALQAGCASMSGNDTGVIPKQRHDFVDISAFPNWFKDAMARESDLSETSTLDIHYYNIHTPVKGNISLVYEDERLLQYSLDIGADAPAECYVIYEHSGLATAISKLTDLQVATVAENNEKPLTSRFVYAIDAGMVSDTPYLSLDTLITLGEGEEKSVGMVKALAAQTNDSLQACFHSSIGFRDTFDEAFESFVQAFTEGETNPEFFETIYKMSIGPRIIGYAREKYSLDADGDVSGTKDSALLIPVDQTNLMTSDSKAISWSHPDGTLINQFNSSVDNGELSSRYTIQHDGTAWRVEGELQGKTIAAELDYNGPLVSDYGSYLGYADLLASDDEQLTMPAWISEADPTAVTEMQVRKVSDGDGANLELTMGSMLIRFVSDEHGVSDNGVLRQGPLEFYFDKLYQKGTPQL